MGDDVNLRGDKRALKMNSWDTQRVWWMPMLTRGKFHVELLLANFPGDRPEGMDVFVAKLRAALNTRFRGDDVPAIVCADRGAKLVGSPNRLPEPYHTGVYLANNDVLPIVGIYTLAKRITSP